MLLSDNSVVCSSKISNNLNLKHLKMSYPQALNYDEKLEERSQLIKN